MGQGEPETRQCPFCGCTFQPEEPDQSYCSRLCEQAHEARRG